MATIDLGKIKQVWRGTYAGSTAYTPDDVVEYTDSGILSSYICIANTTGNAPSSSGTAHGSWNYLAKGGAAGADGTDVGATLANKEIAFKTNAGAVDGIPIGTAGQFLKVNSGATGYEYAAVSSPIKKTYHKMFKGGQSMSGFDYQNPSEVSNYNLTITPTSTSSVFLATYNILIGSHADHTFIQAVAKTGSGSYSKLGTAKASMYNNVGYFDFGTFRVSANSSYTKSATHSFYYAPATTSAITFALFAGQHSNTSYFGRAQDTTTDDYTGLGMTLRVDEYSSSTDLVNTEYTSG